VNMQPLFRSCNKLIHIHVVKLKTYVHVYQCRDDLVADAAFDWFQVFASLLKTKHHVFFLFQAPQSSPKDAVVYSGEVGR